MRIYVFTPFCKELYSTKHSVYHKALVSRTCSSTSIIVLTFCFIITSAVTITLVWLW